MHFGDLPYAMCNFAEPPTLREASYTPFLNALWAILLSQSWRGAKVRSIPLLPLGEKGLGDEGGSEWQCQKLPG